ncbi:MAG TPA: sigma 54-interacting transcriptional regulator [Phycisphaerae bacterium]|nr:sigma 54-interacting transcriptional regulator [Phycisphaerae bacterium]HOJ72663.1 sigma 54-interacting transcriptional regulator [Phycisphaerae bacterium]HOM49676.1 sigma 54-interacting transcriptional regulator [Phycisphaerae bacterium]HON68046.1 sigma 54-interacting transcriptional regulator [Phycisphaerae bacterium]HPP25045.1 sigma 54-interacting transcriptional regulator [Phycisphaerae bacterium]
MNRPSTLGDLKANGYRPRSIRDEMRDNLIRKLRAGEPLFPGIIGYDDTVIPQIVNAILSRHDMLFLGLRGQAKTRMLRALTSLLDEYRPVVADADLPDDPVAPMFRQSRAIIAEKGDETPIRWIHRDDRYQEKLATPDVTIADLLGEIDLVKHAEGRYLADESVMHFGLIPRSNLGIFAINELPDLAPRIQVGLFNVLQERDVQIRGFPVRLPLDVYMVFSANPEDYTNRGRIVTPLKDRIGSVIRTHYPRTIEESMAITAENAWIERDGQGPKVVVPRFMAEVVEEFVRLARTSPHVNQQSGVSVRASITCMETLVSNAERRGIVLGEPQVMPRVSDLANINASCRGKIELMLAEDEQGEDKLITALLGEAVKNVAAKYVDVDELDAIVQQFQGGKTNVEIGDDIASEDLVASAEKVRGLIRESRAVCAKAGLPADEPAALASAAEFILESLYVNNRLSKYTYRGNTFYKR